MYSFVVVLPLTSITDLAKTPTSKKMLLQKEKRGQFSSIIISSSLYENKKEFKNKEELKHITSIMV